MTGAVNTDEILAALKALLDAAGLYAPVRIGALDKGDSVAMYTGPGGDSTDDLLRNSVDHADLVINAKHADQPTAIKALRAAEEAITNVKTVMPTGSGWQVVTITKQTGPGYTGQEDNGRYIWTSTFVILIRYAKE